MHLFIGHLVCAFVFVVFVQLRACAYYTHVYICICMCVVSFSHMNIFYFILFYFVCWFVCLFVSNIKSSSKINSVVCFTYIIMCAAHSKMHLFYYSRVIESTCNRLIYGLNMYASRMHRKCCTWYVQNVL